MPTRRAYALVALALLAVVAAGCSEGDTTDRPADSTEPAETTAAALERYADYVPEQYAGTDNWLCHPDADDLCDDDLDATEITADGATKVLPWKAADDPPVDCFYVYPTISGDESPSSDLEASPGEEGFAARNQVARLGEQCRVFAPVYRQVTLAGLAGAATPEARDTAYADVLDAWKSYMAEANDGRGVVLIGHSQGASLLKALIAEEIDPDDDVRAQLVSAYLAGTSVAVPDGEKVGGDFTNVALCSQPDQTGCVVTWSTYRSTAPPPEDAIFGRTTEEAMRAGCVNPADLSGGSAELSGFFSATRGGTILAGGDDGAPEEPTVDNSWIDPEVATVDTPYVTLPGLTSGECTSDDSTDWLEITVNGDPADPRADDIGGDLSPEWGLHLLDVSLVMGDIQALVTTQSSAYGGCRPVHLVVVEHEADASVRRLAPHLATHRVTMVRPSAGDHFPDVHLTDTDGVIVLGGSMGAYEEADHPWLADEKRWMARVVAGDIPMLGICLGAQLLAEATGGRAFRSDRRVEAGVYQLHPTEAGRQDPVMPHAGTRVFAVHGDTFELPPDATLLARSDGYLQAFRVGSALGVQFHPETDADTALGWARALVAPVLDRAGVTLEQFTAELLEADADLDASAHRFFAAWLDTLGRGSGRRATLNGSPPPIPKGRA